MPKTNLLDPFSDTGPPRVDLFCFCWSFRCDATKQVFSIGQKSSRNLKNWFKGGRKDARTAREVSRGEGLDGLGSLGGHARDRTRGVC